MHPAPRPLSIHIHRNGHQARPDVDASDSAERLQHALVRDPGNDEVRESEDKDVLYAAIKMSQ